MIVRVQGGLGNRLRSMLSRWNTATGFLWEPTEEIAFGKFIDAFEPIEKPIWSEAKYAGEIALSTTDPDWSMGGTYDAPGWAHLYAKLKPRRHIQARIDAMRERLGGDYIAMHVRRTDNCEYARSENALTSDEAFSDFVRGSFLPCFLATDNGRTQRKFTAMHGNVRIVVSNEIAFDEEEIPGGCGRRFTTLQGAVVDLYTCVGAKEFMGSGASSFTKTIEYMRWLR